MKIIKQGIISASHAGKLNYNGWPSVITLSDGTLLAGWSGDRYRHICPFGKVPAARSRDNGHTWSEEIVLREDGLSRDLGYPCTAENRNGELVTVYYQRSEPSGNQIQYTIWKP